MILRVERRLFVQAGTLLCPLLGEEVSIERCWRCPWLKESAGEASPEYVTCELPADALPPSWSGPLGSREL